MNGRRPAATTSQPGQRGQALVEFAVALIPFLLLLLAVVDMGRGIYVYNGVAQAAREIARVTSVHPYAEGCTAGCELGGSAETQEVIATQRSLVPGLEIDVAADIACVPLTAPGQDEEAAAIPDAECGSGDWVRVSLRASFSPVTASFLRMGPFSFASTSRIQVP